jgi:vitamin B12 transporter
VTSPIRRLLVTSILTLTCIVPVTIRAQEEKRTPARVDPVILTATKIETPQERLGASVSVIMEEDLRAGNYTRVEDVLRTVPGVEVVRQGGPGRTTSVTMRGANSNQVQILVDGMRVKSPTLGQFDFADLSVDGIERIEIVRGPQSTLYGADAIGGVINIITKKGSGSPSGFVSAEVGTFETFREAVGTSGAFGPFNFSLSASKFDSRGQERTFDNDDTDQRSVVGRFGVDFPWRGSISLSGRYTKTDVDIPFQGFAPFSRDPDAQQQTEFYLFNLRYDQTLFPWWRLAARAGRFWNNQGNQNGPLPPGDFAFRSQVNTRRQEYELLNTWDTGKINTITLGLEHKREEGENKGTFSAAFETRSLFVQDELRLFDRVFLGGGVRLEDNDSFGSEWTPRLSIAIPVRETDTKIRGAWAKGFRAPTINDLFFPDTTGGFCPPFSNPRLQPERSKSWEAGIDQRLWDKRVRFGATYFRNSFEDLITFVSVGAFCDQAANVGRAHTEGVEFYAEIDPLDWLFLHVNGTHLETEDETTGQELRRHPRFRWNTGFTVTPLRRLSLFAQAHVVSSQLDTGNRHNPGYYRLDAGGTLRLLERLALLDRLDFTMRIQNLTDNRYQEAIGFNAQGFALMAGLKAYFK